MSDAIENVRLAFLQVTRAMFGNAAKTQEDLEKLEHGVTVLMKLFCMAYGEGRYSSGGPESFVQLRPLFDWINSPGWVLPDNWRFWKVPQVTRQELAPGVVREVASAVTDGADSPVDAEGKFLCMRDGCGRRAVFSPVITAPNGTPMPSTLMITFKVCEKCAEHPKIAEAIWSPDVESRAHELSKSTTAFLNTDWSKRRVDWIAIDIAESRWKEYTGKEMPK